ncbi:MAG: hypothetical protein A2X61_08120 [Ignavibacteria bacterium GWB2_35_12]|nr:MAG: hypothetical protein A2X61_08120 [Ignavibacteria bacterium GWB2_35_12]OGU87056.1 MAG: hypothetical protein A2220_08010 [Ignavibacteria bacterium RIFOXYA2_FULL_35_10]OGV20193.1 MAG: hypothetical protein A2475_15220 [Ignavibacteria bacterium RIFOXYC2_FULL_35_21]
MKKLIIRILEILVLVIVSLLIQSCTEGSIYPTLPTDYSKNLLDSGYYPNNVGSYWSYEISISDSIPYVIDTVDVRLVTNEIKADSSQFLTYNYHYYQFGDNDSVYEVLKKDTIERLNNPNISFKSILIIPFSVGEIFIQMIIDSIYNSEQITIEMMVESYDSVFVKAGRFMAYKIVTTVTYQRFGDSPTYTREVLYFVPFIGFISVVNEFWDENNRRYFSKERWELMDFKIEKK